MMNGAIPYSQSKLAQHVWCKHVASNGILPNGVTINVCCPGQVLTNIDTWQVLKTQMGCCWPLISSILGGVRDSAVGARSMMYIMGAKSMNGKTGKYITFGNGGDSGPYYKPCDLEYYPVSGNSDAPAESIVDPAQCKRLFDATTARITELEAKYA